MTLQEAQGRTGACVRTYIHTYIHIYIHNRNDTCIYKHTYIYIHTHIQEEDARNTALEAMSEDEGYICMYTYIRTYTGRG